MVVLGCIDDSLDLQSQGNIDNSKPWYLALALLVGFSLFVQMAEGTSYGMVPFMNREHLAVVSALVGAGGNLGAVIAGYFFYDLIEDELLPFRVHAGYVLFWALLSPFYYWPDKGGMFRGPVEQSPQKNPSESAESSATE